MRRLFVLVLLAILASIPLEGEAVAMQCPICGMPVKIGQNALDLVGNEHLYFCSVAHRVRFTEDPSKWLHQVKEHNTTDLKTGHSSDPEGEEEFCPVCSMAIGAHHFEAEFNGNQYLDACCLGHAKTLAHDVASYVIKPADPEDGKVCVGTGALTLDGFSNAVGECTQLIFDSPLFTLDTAPKRALASVCVFLLGLASEVLFSARLTFAMRVLRQLGLACVVGTCSADDGLTRRRSVSDISLGRGLGLSTANSKLPGSTAVKGQQGYGSMELGGSGNCCDAGVKSDPTDGGVKQRRSAGSRPGFVVRELLLGAYCVLYGVSMVVSYGLMLVMMTYDLTLVCCGVGGITLGQFYFMFE